MGLKRAAWILSARARACIFLIIYVIPRSRRFAVFGPGDYSPLWMRPNGCILIKPVCLTFWSAPG